MSYSCGIFRFFISKTNLIENPVLEIGVVCFVQLFVLFVCLRLFVPVNIFSFILGRLPRIRQF